AAANTENVLLVGEHGGTFCLKLMPGVYEVHTQALPSGRGKWIYDFVKAGSEYMFTHTDAFEIVTRVPAGHIAARRLASTAGMWQEFVRRNECLWRGEKQDVELLSFRIQDWAARQHPKLEAKGREFHDFLHDEAKRIGITKQAHEDDPNHNKYVGITLAMME